MDADHEYKSAIAQKVIRREQLMKLMSKIEETGITYEAIDSSASFLAEHGFLDKIFNDANRIKPQLADFDVIFDLKVGI